MPIKFKDPDAALKWYAQLVGATPETVEEQFDLDIMKRERALLQQPDLEPEKRKMIQEKIVSQRGFLVTGSDKEVHKIILAPFRDGVSCWKIVGRFAFCF